jgi:hypothetical protein
LDGLRKAKAFLFQKVVGYGKVPPPKGALKTNKDNDSSTNFILRCIHQLLLALSIAAKSKMIAQMEIKYTKSANMSANKLKKYKQDLKSNTMFYNAPPGASNKQWGIAHQTFFAALDSFMAYGVAGWFCSLVNY